VSKTILRLILSFLFMASSSLAAPQTFLYLNSQAGDPVGRGKKLFFTPLDGTFNTQSFSTGLVQISFNTSDYSSSWSLEFSPPDTKTFTKGIYEGVRVLPSSSKPMLNVGGNGSGCNTVTGRFLLSDFAFNSDGTVQRFAVDFEQHCDGVPPALYGSIRYNSRVPLVPRVSIADATALKGNAGTSDGDVIVSLSMPSDNLVTVRYATADDSAAQDVDYVRSAGTVDFQPGITSQSINIPILGNLTARGNRSFHVVLTAPTGAPLGNSSANVETLDPNVPLSALAMSSQPGDYVGAGEQYLFTTADSTFSLATSYAYGVHVTVQAPYSWDLDFAAPNRATLTAGAYRNAQRFPFQPNDVPGLNVDGQGAGCNTLTGDFYVHEITYEGSAVQVFSADLDQHCEEAVPALFAWIRINASLRQFSVTNAIIDSGASTAVFTVTLHPAASIPVSVQFTTADGTANAFVDYLPTSQTIYFAAGATAETITVPLLKNPDGGKVFYGELSSPTRVPVWISKASATF
jgi:hypothetical protein